MYDLKIFDDINIEIDWYSLYYGVKNDILNVNTIVDYATRKVEQGKNSVEELDILIETYNKAELIEQVEKIIDFKAMDAMIKGKEKVRIAILANLRKKKLDLEIFFQEIENVYADFGYPSDMESFISYMPASSELRLNCSKIENQMDMLEKFDCFIQNKIKELMVND